MSLMFSRKAHKNLFRADLSSSLNSAAAFSSVVESFLISSARRSRKKHYNRVPFTHADINFRNIGDIDIKRRANSDTKTRSSSFVMLSNIVRIFGVSLSQVSGESAFNHLATSFLISLPSPLSQLVLLALWDCCAGTLTIIIRRPLYFSFPVSFEVLNFSKANISLHLFNADDADDEDVLIRHGIPLS